MLISLHRQLHRLLHQRRGQLLLALLAVLWLALPSSATAAPHLPAPTDTVAAQADNHCDHHAKTNINDQSHSVSHGSGHHGNNHDCHCAQACHASPVAIVVNTLNLPPPANATQPFELPQSVVTAISAPLYRPPITLAA